MTEPYLATLNAEQRRAVEYSGDQPLLIIAGAGSGKTNTLEIKASARQRRLSAMHEAGHAVIGRTLGIKVASAEIFLRSGVYNWGGLIKYDHMPTARQDQQRLSIAGAVGECCWGEFVAGRPSADLSQRRPPNLPLVVPTSLSQLP